MAWIAPLIAEAPWLTEEAISLFKALANHFKKHPEAVPAVSTAVAAAGVDLSSTSLDPDNPYAEST